MYILFEKARANEDNSISNWDAMGYTEDSHKAEEWVNQNSEYRCYKYCSDIKL